MTINEEIISIANKLADEGKKPTVALIKTQLTQAAPLPMIISVLKSWQHTPQSTSVKNSDKITQKTDKKAEITLTIDELEMIINNALAPIKSELAQIKTLLKNTTKK